MLKAADKVAATAVAAQADSVKRQAMWLERLTAQTVSVNGGFFVASATVGKDPRAARFPEDLIWSWSDQGPCEGAVQSEVKRLDQVYKSNMFEWCIWPGGLFGRTGRSCLMQKFACEAAKAGFDVKAKEIAVATQMHNGRGASVQYATPAEVANFLKNNLCPR
jgi:hypothetical protein